MTFFLMADGGTNTEVWKKKLENLPVEEHAFLVHLGSATRVVDNCEDTAYSRTQLSLSASPIVAYSLPGNNDYPECDDPARGWEHYEQHMMDVNTMHWNATEDYDVKRQAGRGENFSFLYKRVLFVGLNTVTNGDSNETRIRMEDNINFVISNVEAYERNVDVIFVMGYGRMLARELAPFYDAMVAKKMSDWKDTLFVYARRASESGLDKNVAGESVKDFHELKVGTGWPILDVRVKAGGKSKMEYRDVVEKEEEEVVDGGGSDEEV